MLQNTNGLHHGMAVFVLLAIASSQDALAQFESFKLVAEDGSASHCFACPVGISGDLAIVGAPGDDDNGSHAGAAYIFDVPTGAQLHKVHLDGGDLHDRFGESVAISGTTAVIAAPDVDDIGGVYVFDAETGLQSFTLQPTDAIDDFGSSIAISGSVAIVGARFADVVGASSGVAYLFDVTTGQQLHKLVPDDHAAYDQFGISVAIHGNIAVVGAERDDDNGEDSGSAYVFDVTSGEQLQKLVAEDGAPFDFFGRSIAVNGDLVVVGTHLDDDFGETSGSAYVFDVQTGEQISKLNPDQASAGDQFGLSVAIFGGYAVVGAPHFDFGGTEFNAATFLFNAVTGEQISTFLPSDSSGGDLGVTVGIHGSHVVAGEPNADSGKGAVYVYEIDADPDGDGLSSDWEVNGIPYTDGNGEEQRYILDVDGDGDGDSDADPLRKDLFVEVDAMNGFSLSNAAVQHLEEAYENAPLDNPGIFSGITLHIVRDQTDLPHVEEWATDGCWPTDFNTWRNNHFGTTDEKASADAAAIIDAKSKAYRYCIVGDRADADIGGCAGVPDRDLVVFFGIPDFQPIDEAAVVMHELGHALGLHHGGGDSINGKVNYPSIMNYVLSYKTNWCSDFWVLDYSREELPQMHESAIDENLGVGASASAYSEYWMPFGVNEENDGVTQRVAKYATLNGAPIDMGDEIGTGYLDAMVSAPVIQDLNYAADAPPEIGLPVTPSLGEVHHGHNDWANIDLAVPYTPGPLAGERDYPADELTWAARNWIDASFPAPPNPCPADLDGNDAVDVVDLLALLGAWGTPGGDVNGDDLTDVQDLLALLAAWGSCDS